MDGLINEPYKITGMEKVCQSFSEDIDLLTTLKKRFHIWGFAEFEKRKISRDSYDELQRLILILSESAVKLKTRIQTLQDVSPNTAVTSRPNYAEVLQLPKKLTQKNTNLASNTILKKEEIVIIKSTQSDGDEKEVNEKIRSMLRAEIPRSENVKVKRTVNMKKGGVLLFLESAKDTEKILKNSVFKKGVLTASEPKAKKPKVIIYDVPVEIKEEELSEVIYEKNNQDITVSKEEFVKGFRPIFKTGPRGQDTTHWVVECEPVIRRDLIKKEKVFFDWTSSRVRDFIVATRCFKCQGHGHTAKVCREKKDVCGHCAAVGHTMKQCPNLGLLPVCSNCKKAGKDSNHKVNDLSCPCYNKALQLIIEKTDYGIV